eukprot:CAMPEP_0177654836 /NCGR_PEP_ID=MMETSP0447-20121125/14577_1 /TAXON_ID=0 /ORGANISM="Stygamoeba regulata, Strain BSH-02190019" /LENGTH=105 /DNA_ID=CAMNT_0019158577 /DNA_START=199 /DNA_END=516 /DNA_ORIENTATION=+
MPTFLETPVISAWIELDGTLFPVSIPVGCNLFQMRRYVMRRVSSIGRNSPGLMLTIKTLCKGSVIPLRSDVVLKAALEEDNPIFFVTLEGGEVSEPIHHISEKNW